MKTCGALLVLLCCCLAEPQFGGETGAAQGTEAADTASTRQTCQPDLHTVVREMTALVAKLEVELRYTKTEMESRLTESEKKGASLETRLRASENLVQQLHLENEALKLSLNDLKEKQEEQAAAVRVLGGSVTLTGSEVEELKRDREKRRVSFSASLVASGSETRGPFNTPTTLVYRHIYTNIGNAYNADTGIFTAPLKGVYHFYFALHGHGSPSIPNAISLRRNREHVVYAWCQQASYSVNPSNGVSLLLEVGDVVYLQLREGARVFDNVNRHTTFSGHLLFEV